MIKDLAEAAAAPARRPIVILGETHGANFVATIRRLGWGRMWLTKKPVPYEDEPWAFDNGAYSAWTHGRSFDSDTFQRRLEQAVKVGVPRVAVAPDIVAAGARSLEFSVEWLPQLPAGWPWYLAVQDGMDSGDVEDALDVFAGLFLGGTTGFKRTADQWARLARSHGKAFHYGRASLPRRVDHACRIGADSLDTAFPLWTRERFEGFVDHWLHGSKQRPFPFLAQA